MINWMFYPKNLKVDDVSLKIIDTFKSFASIIDSEMCNYNSDEVLKVIEPGLTALGFQVEKSKHSQDKISVPVLFGLNGRIEKFFDVDAYDAENKYVVEVEAGRAVSNYQFLKDYFEACTMYNVSYLTIAVRNTYRNANDFEKTCLFFDALYQSGRVGIPLKGLLIIGY